MTRNDLEQIYYLSRELRLLERELEQLRGRSLIASPLPSTSHGSGVSDKVGSLAQRRVDLERLVLERKAEIQSQRDRAMNFIYQIPDSLTRQVVYYRCVSLMSWRAVSREVNNTEDNVRQIYSRFMRKL